MIPSQTVASSISIIPIFSKLFIHRNIEKRSSRLALYRVSPSTEPDVQLSRIRLLAKFIVQQLSFIDFHIYSRLRKWVGFQHLSKALPVVASLLASLIQPVVQALSYLKAKV